MFIICEYVEIVYVRVLVRVHVWSWLCTCMWEWERGRESVCSWVFFNSLLLVYFISCRPVSATVYIA